MHRETPRARSRYDERFDDSDLPKDCPICMGEFDAEEPIRQTPCGHVPLAARGARL